MGSNQSATQQPTTDVSSSASSSSVTKGTDGLNNVIASPAGQPLVVGVPRTLEENKHPLSGVVLWWQPLLSHLPLDESVFLSAVPAEFPFEYERYHTDCRLMLEWFPPLDWWRQQMVVRTNRTSESNFWRSLFFHLHHLYVQSQQQQQHTQLRQQQPDGQQQLDLLHVLEENARLRSQIESLSARLSSYISPANASRPANAHTFEQPATSPTPSTKSKPEPSSSSSPSSSSPALASSSSFSSSSSSSSSASSSSPASSSSSSSSTPSSSSASGSASPLCCKCGGSVSSSSPSPASTHSGQWKYDTSGQEWLSLDETLKANLRQEKAKRISEATKQMDWIPEVDEEASGAWTCCQAKEYRATCSKR